MTNTPPLDPNLSKVQAVAQWISQRIQWAVYSPNQRVPSIRQLAKKLGVSAFTVTQAYEHLVAENVLTAKPGSGFYVRAQSILPAIESSALPTSRPMDTRWLIQHMFSDIAPLRSPGSGMLPPEWMHYDKLQYLLRQVVQEVDSFAYDYGTIQGYLPLRQFFAQQLDVMGVHCPSAQIITTSGVADAVNIVARGLLSAGETVLVDEPGWFWLSGNLLNQGLKVIGVARDGQGPDIAQLTRIMQVYRPKLYVTNSVLHNPTSYNLHPARAHQVLNLIHQYDSYILEDDLFSAFDPGGLALRYAILDQCQRVFYVTGVSKSVGANWRVGLLACPKAQMDTVIREKMLSHITGSQFNERVIHKWWSQGDYRRQIRTIQQKLYQAHQWLRRALPEIGLQYPEHAQAGMFLWLDTGVDSSELALSAYQDGWLVAPGQLFFPQAPSSTYMRLNVACTTAEFLQWLADYLQRK